MKILPVLLLFLPLTVYAEWGQFDFEFENEKPWVELSAQLPPPPKPENLVGFDVSPVTQNNYFIDTASITVGEDKVVRYSVVIEAAGGAKSVSFEGMRCATGEHRLYAYGQPDGSWSKARNTRWEGIKFRSPFSYQKALYEDHFCPDGIAVRNANAAVSSLRRGTR